jgi:hypothetical protein
VSGAAYFTLEIEIHRGSDADTYELTVSHQDPRSQASAPNLHGRASFDLTKLLATESRADGYGEALSRQLFSDEHVERRFVEVEREAQSAEHFLRVVLRIDASASHLQSLRWELLRHPKTGVLLATSERILLSRFMSSDDRRPVRLRERAEVSALVAIAAVPHDALARSNLAPVDFDGEAARAKAALGDAKLRVLGGPDAPCTRQRLIAALRDGVDILYFVGHGQFNARTGQPSLLLPSEDGGLERVDGEALVAEIVDLQHPPRLAVLASCQSAGDGELQGVGRPTVQASLAGRLADAVAAVIAMQGFISVRTVESMMPSFFAELWHDGQIDRALAVARGLVKARHDAWMPALYSRLLDGRLWSATAPQLVVRPGVDAAQVFPLKSNPDAAAVAAHRSRVAMIAAPADARWLKQLRTHLKPLARAAKVEVWDSSVIAAGTAWREAVEEGFAQARVVVVVVGPELLADDEFMDGHLPRLVVDADADSIHLLSLIVSASAFASTALERFRPLNHADEPLDAASPSELNRRLLVAAKQIVDIAKA